MHTIVLNNCQLHAIYIEPAKNTIMTLYASNLQNYNFFSNSFRLNSRIVKTVIVAAEQSHQVNYILLYWILERLPLMNHGIYLFYDTLKNTMILFISDIIW